MNFSEPFSMVLSGAMLVAAVCFFLRNSGAHEASGARRRRRNYGRVVSKARRPMIMLSVHTARH